MSTVARVASTWHAAEGARTRTVDARRRPACALGHRSCRWLVSKSLDLERRLGDDETLARRALGVSCQAACSWLELWGRGGVEALTIATLTGRFPKITDEQLAAVEPFFSRVLAPAATAPRSGRCSGCAR